MTTAATPSDRCFPWRGLAAAFVMVGLLGCTEQTPPTGQALTPQDLTRKNGCMACHGMVHKQIGPGFAQVAERYRNDADAPVRLATKIRHGGVGAWGRIVMPAQSLLTEADAQKLATWVLSQPSPPP